MASRDQQATNVERRRRANRNTLIVVGAIIGAICLCGGCGALFGNDDEPNEPDTTTATRMTTPPPSTTRPSTTTPVPSTTLTPPPATSSALPPVEEQAPRVPASVESSPTPSPIPPPPPVPELEWTPEPTIEAPPPPPAPRVYYKNCDAVRAAGAAPIYAGQPGYAPHLDRDGDGIGCET